MPATYTDQFYVMDPANPPASGSSLTMVTFDLIDEDDDGDISRAGDDTVDGIDVRRAYAGDTITVEYGDGSIHTITGTTFYLADGREMFTPTDGSILEDATFLSSTWVTADTQLDVADLGPACFTPGTMITTPKGHRLIQDLKAGDWVTTRDNGPQQIRWIAKRQAIGDTDHIPIRICKNALRNTADLIVSPQHKLLITGWRAELFFGRSQALVAAKHLVNGDTIVPHPMPVVDYLHLIFDAHEIIYAEDCPTESFDLGGDLALYDRELRKAVHKYCTPDRHHGPKPTATNVALRYEALAMAV